jgi:molecular chaperone GrpE (heat shock protein)/DNA-binding Xre family transcriptional regulator
MNQGSIEYTHRLRSLMQSVGVSSFKALSQTAGVSEWQVRQLRQGNARQMSLEALYKLSEALQIPLIELIAKFSDLPIPSSSGANSSTEQDLKSLQQEYERLQAQLTHQKTMLHQEFQQASLQILESLILQLPTVAHAVQQNSQLPASRLLPLLKPINQLLNSWEIEAIASVGTEELYNPQIHQLLEGTANAGDRVKIRYVGYRQGERLLHRAKVSPI